MLTKATAILAGVFVVTSLALSMLRPKSSSVLDRVQTPPAQASPAAGVPATTAPAPATSPSTP